MRLNKFVAHATGMSRREADFAIREGRVTINDDDAVLGNTVDIKTDVVQLDHNVLALPEYQYVLVNKPEGYVCSRAAQGDAPTIYALLPKELHVLKVAGRLDKDSSGLVLLSDDGELIHTLTHPKHGKQKQYVISTSTAITDIDLMAISGGVELEDGVSAFDISPDKSSGKNTHNYRIAMYEGRNRQIRRTLAALGYEITRLHRQAMGSYELGELKAGSYRKIQPHDRGQSVDKKS